MLRRVIAWTVLATLMAGQLSDLAYAQIVADGRTDTSITTGGGVTTITTGTVVGETGLNSFSQFDVGQGHVVNMHLPAGTTSLVNVVSDKTSLISGTVNAVRNGAIGGKLYFLNPHGIIVTESGVINAGAVGLYAAATDFVEGLFDELGRPVAAEINRVAAGDVPLANADVRVDGTINASGDISLAGRDVSVGGAVFTGALFSGTGPDFSDVVNTNGLTRGGSVTFENGTIRIQAARDANVTGSLVARGTGSVQAGDIYVSADRTIQLTGATILADAPRDQAADPLDEGSEGNEEKPDRAGQVLLGAGSVSKKDVPIYSVAEAEGRIIIDRTTIKASHISAGAVAVADDGWDPTNPRDLLRTGTTLFNSLFLADVNYIGATAKAEVIVRGGSVLEASSEAGVSLQAQTVARSGLVALSGSQLGVDLADVGFVYNKLDASASVHIEGDVTIMGPKVYVGAVNTAETHVSVVSASYDRDTDIAIAVTEADVKAETVIADGAKITGRFVEVLALNDSSFQTGATVLSLGKSKGGIAFAYSKPTTQAIASVSGDITTTDGWLMVEASDLISRDQTTASVTSGTNLVFRLIYDKFFAGSATTEAASQLADNSVKGDLDQRSGVTEQRRLGSAVAVSDSGHKAYADIGTGAVVDTQDVVVVAEVEHQHIRTFANSSVETSTRTDPNNPATSQGISAAVAYGNFGQDARAWIGEGADVSAARLAVQSNALVPYEIRWDKWEGPETVTSKLSSDLGIGYGFLTGWANSSASTTELGMAGSVLYFDFDTKSLAYVDRGATVKTQASSSPWLRAWERFSTRTTIRTRMTSSPAPATMWRATRSSSPPSTSSLTGGFRADSTGPSSGLIRGSCSLE